MGVRSSEPDDSPCRGWGGFHQRSRAGLRPHLKDWLEEHTPKFRSITARFLKTSVRSFIKRLLTVLAFSSVQSLSRVWLFVTPWTAARQASLSFTISRSLLKLMSIESVMPSNHLIPCRPLLLLPSVFPSIRVFSSESVLCIRCPKYWSSVLPMNIQGWFPLGLTSCQRVTLCTIHNS